MKILLLLSMILLSQSAQAYLVACQLVAETAGKQYLAKPERFATITAPEDLPDAIKVTLIERNGMWFIYQADRDWFEREACAPRVVKGIETVPVILNQHSGRNAVVNGAYLIKTWKVEDVDKLIDRYRFSKVTQLPNRFTAIFDTKPQASYDELIEILDRDKDIQLFAPLLSEPRYRPR